MFWSSNGGTTLTDHIMKTCTVGNCGWSTPRSEGCNWLEQISNYLCALDCGVFVFLLFDIGILQEICKQYLNTFALIYAFLFDS